jgi:predicted phosphodiesterase
VKVAALYDVYGNLPALQAVLADLGDVDAIVFGGDLLYGAWPSETLELACSLGERAHFIRGNWERYSDWSAFTQPLVVCGHTHVQYDIQRDSTRVVNPGSVGLPTVRATAWWAVVTDGTDVDLRTTDYDTGATARAIRETAFPEQEFADFVRDPVSVERIVELVSS